MGNISYKLQSIFENSFDIDTILWFSAKADDYDEGFTRSTIDLYLGVDPKLINDELREVLHKIRAFITKVDRYTRVSLGINRTRLEFETYFDIKFQMWCFCYSFQPNQIPTIHSMKVRLIGHWKVFCKSFAITTLQRGVLFFSQVVRRREEEGFNTYNDYQTQMTFFHGISTTSVISINIKVNVLVNLFFN